MNLHSADTIAAIATPPGNGGIGVIRLSGEAALAITVSLCQKSFLTPRYAHKVNFFDAQQQILDSGITLYFPAPASYTGENVCELQAHGGRVVLQMLLKRVLQLGARLARPGEFTERAFLNGKLDLAQAEAVADLITSSTEQAVRAAQQSMQGVFSAQIQQLVAELTQLRVSIEAALDFSDEDIDFLHTDSVVTKLSALLHRITHIKHTASQGRLLHDGMHVVLAGLPNAGKSSLLNALAGYEVAIVNEAPGTTRDVLREHIQLEGMPLHISDTAGIHDSADAVEQEGIRRAQQEITRADKVLLLIDAQSSAPIINEPWLTSLKNVTEVYNKIDLLNRAPAMMETAGRTQIYLSAKTGAGLDLLITHLKASVGFNQTGEQPFVARQRHLDALQYSSIALTNALRYLQTQHTDDLLAEELRVAQNHLSSITGEFTADDLLGKIFADFCIGK